MQIVRQGPSVTFIATACIAIVLAVLLLWQWLHKASATPGTVAAKPAPIEQPAPTHFTPTPPLAPAPVAVVPTPATAPEPAPVAETKLAANVAAPANDAVATSATFVQEKPQATVPVAEPPPPKPAPPKLQAIVYRRTRPSAMISGKTLFVGDKFGDWRLVAISEESATLVGGGLTNVLVLPQ
jgi:hypothetical protein